MALNILLVDDSATTRSIVGRTLRMSGLSLGEVHEAENGHQALDLLDRHWVDLVISDLNMPVMGGIDLIGRMKDDPLLRTVPVLVVTAEGNRRRIEGLKASGLVTGYLRKPCSPEQIHEAVHQALGIPDSVEPRLVSEVLMDVLGTYAYLYGDAVSPAELPVPPATISVGMSFTGSFSGRLTMVMPERLAAAVAANALGATADDVSTRMGGDAAAELLNIVCGRLLTVLSGELPVFEVTAPEISAGDASDWLRTCGCPHAVGFMVEGEPLVLGLECEVGR